MSLKKFVLCLIILITAPLSVFSQPLPQQISQAMDRVRSGQYYNGSEAPFAQNLKNNPGALIDALIPYTRDTFANVRKQAADIIYLASYKSADNNLRQKAVQHMVSGCGDKESGNAYKTGKYLLKYKRDDFNNIAKDSLAAFIKRGVYYLDNVIKLAGYLNLSNAIPDIIEVINTQQYDDKTKWAAHLALSRMGDNTETTYCLRVVRSKTMNNAVIYNFVPDLVYTRQKEVFDYLVTLLNSDEKNCTSPNPDNDAQIVCGYRVMEFLAPVIKNFPLQNIEGVNQIKTDNYAAALETARKWFKAKEGKYEIKNESY